MPPTAVPLPVFNPATGKEIGRVAHAGKADLDKALEAAQKGLRDLARHGRRPTAARSCARPPASCASAPATSPGC
jgi:acyl-CoA reductase-like NAD-dependent aldehyde dehydrogenase